MSSGTKSEKDEVTILSTIQATVDDNDPSKDKSEKIIDPCMFNKLVVSEGLEELRPASYVPLATHTLSFIPQKDISTEVTPPAFVTPKRRAKKVAFTVEDYLKSLSETQKRRLTEKTNQKIETLLELKKKAKELITSIPII